VDRFDGHLGLRRRLDAGRGDAGAGRQARCPARGSGNARPRGALREDWACGEGAAADPCRRGAADPAGAAQGPSAARQARPRHGQGGARRRRLGPKAKRASRGAATRARASGLVPELRLRVAHVVDEDQRLAPTEYDPERITASGGTSLWLEARATFQLDRLVFADDEIALERLRADRAKLEAELIDDVLKSLEAWMRAGAALESEIASEEERLRADVDEAVAEARLDALTAGWFSTQRAQMKSSESLTTRVDDAVSSF
jgi:hypothetical protein